MEASRRFNFFEKKLVQVCQEGKGNPNFESVVDTAGSDSFLWLLESFGLIHVLYRPQGSDNRNNILKCRYFKAFELEARRIFYCTRASALIVLGKDEESNHMLKFNTYRVPQSSAFDNSDELLPLVQSVPLFSQADGLLPDQVQSISVSQCATMAAIATSKGAIYIYRNYLLPPSESEMPPKTLLAKLSINDLKQGHNPGDVRFIHLKQLSDGCFALAICCKYAILSVRLDSYPELIYINLLQSIVETSCDIQNEPCFAVAQSDGNISIYNIVSGMITCYQTNGICSSLCSYKRYIASASLETTNAIESSYSTTLVTVKSVISDMEFVAHSQYILVVLQFEASMGSLYLLTRYGNNKALILFELREKSVKERIQIFIRKHLFDWAIKVAALEKRPVSECEEIHKIHANWLYQKADYNASLEAYCKAGASVEPAFVIERFMSMNSKLPVFNYLLHIHRDSRAHHAHTVLLMRVLQTIFETHYDDDAVTTVAKEVDCSKLLADFLNEFGESHKEGIRDALYECRSSGGSNFARMVELAQQDHEEYVNILVEDFQDYKTALEHLKSVEMQIALNAILKHGRQLVRHDPQAVMTLILQICESTPQTNGAVHEAFVPVFTMEDKFLGDMLGIDNSNSSLLIFSTRLQLMLDQLSNESQKIDDKQKKPPGNIDTEVLENRLWNLLNANTQFRDYQLIALTLCLIYKYQRGANAMAIKMGYYHLPLVLTGILDGPVTGNKFNILQHALSYGYNEPTLWVETLSLLMRSSDDNGALIRDALQHIQTQKLLSFPSVMNILKTNPKLRFGEVKAYLRNEFQRIEETIEEHRQAITHDKTEYAQMNRDLQRLQHSYFVINNTNCSRCELLLEMPSLHFYCQHSFHSYCVGLDNVCPKCSSVNQDGRDTNGQQDSGDQDSFFKFLRGATDPFDYMAQQIGRFSLG